MRTILLVTALLAACSSNDDEIKDKQAECDAVEADIRTKAVSYGIPAQGACNNPSPQIQSNFANACKRLETCRAELAELKN